MNNRHNFLVALGSGALAAISLFGYLIWTGYQGAIHAAETTTRNYAAIIEARLDATLRRTDAELQEMASMIPVAALSQQAVPRYALEIKSSLKSGLIEFPELGSLRIFDANGEVMYFSDDKPVPRTSISDRNHFRQVRDNRQAGLVFSEVVISRITGQPSLFAARALRDKQGAFRGVIIAAINLDYFQKLFKSLDIGPRAIIAIYRSDNFARVTRWPVGDDKLNAPLPPDSQAQKMLASGNKTATAEITSPVDGIARIYSLQALDRYPFFVSVGVTREEVLAAWKQRSLMVGLSGLLLVGLMAGLLYRLLRAEATLRASEERYRSLTKLSSDWYWEQDSELRFVSTSGEHRDLGGITPEDHDNRRRWELPGTEIIGQSWEEHQALLAARKPFRDLMLKRTAADGRIHFISVAGEPVFDRAGTFTGYRGVARDVTQRVVADNALKANEELMRSTFERAAVGIAHVTPGTYRILMANDKFCHLLGYTQDELIGTDYRSHMHPDELLVREAERAQITAGTIKTSTSDRRVIRKDGSLLWVNRSLSLVRDAAGQPQHFISIIEDISERKRAQAAVDNAKQRLEIALEGSHISVWETDLRSNEVWLDAGWAVFLGKPRTETRTTAAELLAIVHPDDRQAITAVGIQAMKGEIPSYAVEHRVRSAGGEWKWILSRGRVIKRDASGRPLRLSGTNTDITENKQAEKVRRAGEEQFRGLVEQSIAGIYIIQDGRFAYVNPRFAEIFGYSAGELIGRDPLSLTAEKDRGSVVENFRRRLDGEVRSVSYGFTGVRKDGAMIDVGVHGSYATHQGRPAIIGLLQDVSEKKRAEEQIQRHIVQLETAFMHSVKVATTLSEMRDPYTAGHERRVGEIAVAIGAELGFDARRQEGLRVAGYLHDVGKMTIPAEILAKPGKLSAIEFSMMKEHPQASYEVLKDVEFPWPVAQVALQHHERMDGSGYPQGLKGEEILFESRIMSVADVIEAMSGHRPYRAALGIDKALAEIERGRGTVYDPQVADACLRLFREKNYPIPA